MTMNIDSILLVKRNRIRSLPVVLVWLVLLISSVPACGGQGNAERLMASEAPVSTATSQSSSTAGGAEPVRETPTPYSLSVPSPVIVTATPVPRATAVGGNSAAKVAVSPTVGVATRTAAPAAPVETPASGVVKTPAAVPVQMPVNWPTPEELAAVEWGKFRERGYFFRQVSNGKTINVYEGPKKTRRVTCGPEIGTAFDSSNPTWNDSSHWVWVWKESDGWGSSGCWGVSKYENWVNKPLPAEPLEQSEIIERHVRWGEPLRFAHDDFTRDFSVMLHDTEPGAWDGDQVRLNDGLESRCDVYALPFAAWTRERGFYTISIKDEEAQMRTEWTDEQIALKEEWRTRGWFYIYKGMQQRRFCWHVPNHEDIPPHRPCLECQWRR